jgi:hypothetical protein
MGSYISTLEIQLRVIAPAIAIARDCHFNATTVKVNTTTANKTTLGVLSLVANCLDQENLEVHLNTLKDRLKRELGLEYIGYSSPTSCIMLFNMVKRK